MTGIFRTAVVAALAGTFVPAVAVAQNASVDSLLRRIEVLERTTIDLQLRVRELEVLVRSEPSGGRRAQGSPKWRDVQNWRQLRRGMTTDEVRALLGEPDRVDTFGAGLTVWSWESGTADLRFDRSSRLDSWSEPRG